MKYNFDGKIINISEKEIINSMKVLNISREEAIQMYLEDEGYLENKEQIALEEKAKKNHITATIHQAKNIENKKTQKERVKKDDPTKEMIINECAKLIKNLCGNAEITNKTKLIAFELDGEKYELNLIRKRVRKSS